MIMKEEEVLATIEGVSAKAAATKTATAGKGRDMAKLITYGDASRQAILRGVSSLANAVKVTLGPKGAQRHPRQVLRIAHDHQDGTVAKEIDLPDPLENMGAQMVREVASKRVRRRRRRHTRCSRRRSSRRREELTAGANRWPSSAGSPPRSGRRDIASAV
jgi:hypothetical protein